MSGHPDQAELQALAGEIASWHEALALAVAAELPLDYPRDGVQSYMRDEVTLQLKPTESSQNASLSLLTALGVVASVYHRQEPVCLGVATGCEGVSVVVPVVLGFNPEMEFDDLQTHAAGALDAALQQVGSAALQGTLAAFTDPDPTRVPPFRILLVDQCSPQGLADSALYDIADVAQACDLVVYARAEEAALNLRCEYDIDRLEATTVSRFRAHLQGAWTAIAEDEKGQLADIHLTSTDELALLAQWNQTDRDYGAPVCLHALFEAQVARSPDATALSWEGGSLSYAQFNACANHLAWALHEKGIGPDQPVAVLLERGPEMVLALYAILKAGGAYVPIDPAYPDDRVAFMVSDTSANVVLTVAAHEDRVPGEAVAILLDAGRLAKTTEDPGVPSPGPSADSLAYIIYTSGSTGQPKGVMNNHRGIVNRLLWMQEQYGLTSADTVLQKTPFTFDVSVWEFFWPLICGARLAVAGPQAHRDTQRLAELIREFKVTTLHFVPSMLQLFLEEDSINSDNLQRVFCSGEALPHSLQERFFERLPAVALHNLYGPTEAAVDVSFWACQQGDDRQVVPIGAPVANTRLYVLDEAMRPQPIGVPGELYIGGVQVARGYLNRDELTAERFVADPFSDDAKARLYRTGDLVRMRPDGNLDFLGRLDFQVKMRGLRIELGEIEQQLLACDGVREAVVLLREDRPGDQRLVAYVTARDGTTLRVEDLGDHLASVLPEFMLPHPIVILPEFPLNTSGKVDRKSLPEPVSEVPQDMPSGQSDTEAAVAAVWCDLLGVSAVGLEQNFFDLGGHSILVARVRQRLNDELGGDLSMAEMFRHTTVAALARRLDGGRAQPASMGAVRRRRAAEVASDSIAVVGLACRLPGARDVNEFWHNLSNGVESVSFFSEEELIAEGIDEATVRDPEYVRARAVLDDADLFDAGFFGYSPREAEQIDPQQRIFLEVAWHALEDAGYALEEFPMPVGVYAGAGMNTYLVHNLHRRATESGAVGAFQVMIGNDKDFLPTRVSYKFNLKGPSINVQTACSTSLVAVHTACRALLEGECDMAIAGGVTVHIPQRTGYQYQDGMILSSDGHCRAFDAKASGTIFGSGASVVVLKPLSQAQADGDHIHAVIRGSAINNDGSQKIGYTAPSVEGQSAVIRAAQAEAGVDPRSIGYVETHGTATSLGDPIEIEALTEAFRAGTSERGFCGIGSVKTNIGHTDAAAGATGLIKAILCLKHGKRVPSLHYENPNPEIDFESSPFYVVTETADWPADDTPRRAGVSSFGIGGTNAHVIVEEAESVAEEDVADAPTCLLTLSARDETALQALAGQFSRALAASSDHTLNRICYSANSGRRRFEQGLSLVAPDAQAMAQALQDFAEQGRHASIVANTRVQSPRLALLMTGQGSQRIGMGAQLYETLPVFRDALNQCAEILTAYLDRPLLDVMHAGAQGDHGALLDDTRYTQPALFALEYSLACQWQHWGFQPDYLLGHSVGEYPAACLAGVFSLEDGLKLIAHRGRLMSALPRDGAMLAVMADQSLVAEKVAAHLDRVSIGAVNGPRNTVISGDAAVIANLKQQFDEAGIDSRQLNVSHAFHSPLMDAILDEFRSIAETVSYQPPRGGLISNVSGKLAGPEVASADYWCRHIREAVNFHAGMESLLAQGSNVVLECGPQPTLTGMARASLDSPDVQWVTGLSRDGDELSDLLLSLGQLANAGLAVDWSAVHGPSRRVPLPAYPFQRQRCWVEPEPVTTHPGGEHPLLGPRLALPLSPEARYTARFEFESPPYVKDHRIFGVLVVAGASHCSLLLQACTDLLDSDGCVLEELYFLQPFVLQEQDVGEAQVVIGAPEEGRRSLQLLSLQPGAEPSDSEHWKQHVRGQLQLADADQSTPKTLDIQAVRERCHSSMDHEPFYRDFWVQGDDAGPSFRWIETVWQGDDEAIAVTTLPNLPEDTKQYQLYPGIIEACFQVLRSCREFESQSLLAAGGYIYVPFSIARFELLRQPSGSRLWCYARMLPESNDLSAIGDLLLAEDDGTVIARIDAFECRRLPQETLLRHLYADTSDWLYELRWQSQAPLAPPAASVRQDNWLILDDGQGTGEAVAAQLEQLGHTAILAHPGDAFGVDDTGDYQLDATAPEQYRELIAAAARSLPGEVSLRGVINLWGLNDKTESFVPGLGAQSALHLAQALVTTGWSQPPQLWLTTLDAREAESGSCAPAQAAAWGLSRVLVQEHPELAVRCVDLSADSLAQAPSALIAELYSDGSEDMVALRGSSRYLPRLLRYREPVTTAPRGPLLRDNSTYLVTGGTGGLGLAVARWLIENGARHLVLCSRSGGKDALATLAEPIAEYSAQVVVVACDISQPDAVAELFAQIDNDLPPLAGVIHTAGTLADGMAANQDWAQFQRVFGAKLAGAWYLHEHTRERALDFFLGFSSASALLGAPGQANYAAANASLDSLMHYRRRLGLPGVSVNWGPWAEAGMAASLSERDQQRSANQGWSRIDLQSGLSLLGELLRDAPAQVAVLPLHWGKFATALFDGELPAFLRTWQPRAEQVQGAAAAPSGGAARSVLEAPPERREEALRDYVTAVVADLLGHSDIDPQLGFTEMGMDSLMGVDLRAILQKSLDVSLASTFAFDYSNVESVVAFLLEAVFPDSVEERVETNEMSLDAESAGSDELDDAVAAELAALERELGRED